MKRGVYTEQIASRLPGSWDELAETYFQKRAFLTHTEKYNPCGQRYHMLYRDSDLEAAAIAYTMPLDLLTFLHLPSPFQMNIIGVPSSVSCPGIFGSTNGVRSLKEIIFSRERGFCLFLNLPNADHLPKKITGPTLPTVILENSFDNWADYVSSLRSDYRRRLMRILEKGKALEFDRLSCKAFTNEMHGQYLNVFQKSQAKLEKLEYPFFKNLPEEFTLITARKDKSLAGWVITLSHGDHYIFFLGGVDYLINQEYDTYFNLLAAIVKEGVAHGMKMIDLGQTAEVPKLRLGGQYAERYLEAQHSNPLFMKLLVAGRKLLTYHREVPLPHVIKRDYEYSAHTS